MIRSKYGHSTTAMQNLRKGRSRSRKTRACDRGGGARGGEVRRQSSGRSVGHERRAAGGERRWRHLLRVLLGRDRGLRLVDHIHELVLRILRHRLRRRHLLAHGSTVGPVLRRRGEEGQRGKRRKERGTAAKARRDATHARSLDSRARPDAALAHAVRVRHAPRCVARGGIAGAQLGSTATQAAGTPWCQRRVASAHSGAHGGGWRPTRRPRPASGPLRAHLDSLAKLCPPHRSPQVAAAQRPPSPAPRRQAQSRAARQTTGAPRVGLKGVFDGQQLTDAIVTADPGC